MSRQKITIVLWNLRLVAALRQKELHRTAQFVSRYIYMTECHLIPVKVFSSDHCRTVKC